MILALSIVMNQSCAMQRSQILVLGTPPSSDSEVLVSGTSSEEERVGSGPEAIEPIRKRIINLQQKQSQETAKKKAAVDCKQKSKKPKKDD